ncbi:uncharacterized protein FIBRA_02574 [Fibroporia radiculosa]|uniref:Agglutinin domain-containing protein n=1 Tax=Fibroporia radiculosa TaxID=599839 RepID=J4GMZ5_9APHY|nr:uncharacterized protein FIBRA_02574 [Fibroporia radiculosa]CCM00540.1 predicted protein [Fibroporia radiculosa]
MSLVQDFIPYNGLIIGEDGFKRRRPRIPDAGESRVRYLLPNWLYIRDRNGRYFTKRPSPDYRTLTLRGGDPDADCLFQAVPTRVSGHYSLRGNDGRYWVRYDTGWLSSDYITPYAGFRLKYLGNNSVYFTDNLSPSDLYLSSKLDNLGSPLFTTIAGLDDSCCFEIVSAALETDIYDIHYNLAGAQIRGLPPTTILITSISNNSDSPASRELYLSYKASEDGTWNNAAGIEIGISSSFSAGVPSISSTDMGISISKPCTHLWGGTAQVEKTVSETVTVTVPPRKKAKAIVALQNAEIIVGFTYRKRTLYTNGRMEDEVEQGIYRNVDSYHINVQLTDWESTD